MPAPAFLLPSVSSKSKIDSLIFALAICYGFDAAYLYAHLLGIPYRHLRPARLAIVCRQQHICIIHEVSVPGKHA